MVIVIFVLSAMAGNLVTSFFYRLPRNIPIHRDSNPPMCSNCGAKLKLYQFMPLFYRVFCGKKSPCCQTEIPFVYTVIELFVITNIFIAYFLFGLNSLGLSVILSVPVITTILFIFYYHKAIPKDLLWAQILCLAIYKFYGLKIDLIDVIFVLVYTLLTLLIIEKICKNILPADLRVCLTIMTGFMPDGLPFVLYIVFIFILWFLMAKKIISKDNVLVISAIVLWFPFMWLNYVN